jgi:hypothetical protein
MFVPTDFPVLRSVRQDKWIVPPAERHLAIVEGNWTERNIACLRAQEKSSRVKT